MLDLALWPVATLIQLHETGHYISVDDYCAMPGVGWTLQKLSICITLCLDPLEITPHSEE